MKVVVVFHDMQYTWHTKSILNILTFCLYPFEFPNEFIWCDEWPTFFTLFLLLSICLCLCLCLCLSLSLFWLLNTPIADVYSIEFNRCTHKRLARSSYFQNQQYQTQPNWGISSVFYRIMRVGHLDLTHVTNVYTIY